MADNTDKVSDVINSGCVALNLRRAARLVTRRFEEALRPFELTVGQFSILFALVRHGSEGVIPQTALADEMGMEPTTLTRNLRPMIKRGLLEVFSDRDDRRVKLVRVDDNGRALYAAALPAWADAQRASLDRLTGVSWAEMKSALAGLS